MSKLDDYYAYKVTTSNASGGGGGDGCLTTMFFAILGFKDVDIDI